MDPNSAGGMVLGETVTVTVPSGAPATGSAGGQPPGRPLVPSGVGLVGVLRHSMSVDPTF